MRRNTRLDGKQRLLDMETLENRYALDGNLHAFVQNGILFVIGDEAGNVAELSSAASGEITVTGIDTTVNDGVEPVTFTGVKSVVVKLNDGDDQLTVSNGDVGGETGGDLGITQVAPVNIERQLLIAGGRGNDVLNISANVGWGMGVGGGLGDDVINVLDTNVVRGAGISGAGGNDTITVTDSTFKALGIAGWAGTDVLALTGIVAENVIIDTGTGDDTAALDDVQVSQALFAQMGDGDDTLSISNSSANWAILLGWLGDDTLNNGPNNSFNNESISGF
jgi:hypothetical protein